MSEEYRNKARLDFRYQDKDGDTIEAYQVTKGSRWANQWWPAWLKVQQNVKDTNCVYTDSSAPDALFISINGSEFQIADGAYIMFQNGSLGVEDGQTFESKYEKVVPVPPKPEDPESMPDFELMHEIVDGKAVRLSPAQIAENMARKAEMEAASEETGAEAAGLEYEKPVVTQLHAEDVTVRTKAEMAYEMLLEGNAEAAQSILRRALEEGVQWCNCAPGSCDNGPKWACRQKSPLIQ